MSLSNAVPDAKALEGRKDGENRPSFQSRDFFLDSVTIFVVGAILALSAIDVVSEFIRRSRVQCFFDRSAVNDSFENVGEYVNEKCAASLPPTEYLPAFISVHAILILAPHYIWQNVFGANLDYFSHLVSGLSRTRDPNTGDYPENNYVISRQLDALTSGAHRSNYMYKFCLVKLFIQFLFAVGGLVLVVVGFRDFNDSFTCPGDMEDTLRDDWPLTGERVKCVFTSLRLLQKVWFVYLILLVAALICITLSFLILLFTDHTKELGLEKVSELFFQTSLQFEHYTPHLTWGEKLSHAFLALLCKRFADSSVYRIQTDYDFLLVKLFRTDGGLAQVLREVHLLRLLKEQNIKELASVRTIVDVSSKEKKGMPFPKS